MSNLVYLLGAGASANAIPVVSKFNDRLKLFIDILSCASFKKKILFTNFKLTKIYNKYVELFENLFPEIENHASIDTLAKKLYLRRELAKLHVLKKLISSFLVFEQKIKDYNPVDELDVKERWEKVRDLVMFNNDKRYDVFLASILSEKELKILVPKDINVVSWNYDNQIELSYNDFLVEDDEYSHHRLNCVHKHLHENENPFLIKLNGSASWYHTKKAQYPEEGYHKYENLNQHLLHIICKEYEEGHHFIKFAWEADDKIHKSDLIQNDSLNQAIECFKNAEILVIIGYSFPTYNRQVDRRLFSALPSNLQTIYVQNPNQDITKRVEAILEGNRYSSHFEDVVKHIPDKDQFYLPFEYA